MSKPQPDRVPAPTANHPARGLAWRRLPCPYRVILILAVCLLGLELVLRLGFGLGSPPLMVSDPEIEYIFRPSMRYRRFGNVIAYNRYSMRSPDFCERKSDPHELRLLVCGDSVVNGGARLDQEELATSLLRSDLSAALDRPVVVGNISCGSWGPPNLLAYSRRFGFLDADAVVIVLSSHDYGDAPTFEARVGVDPSLPDESPPCALYEVLTRYLPRVLSRGDAARLSSVRPSEEAIGVCLSALAEMIRDARNSGAAVFVALHYERGELGVPEAEGHRRIREVAKQAGARLVQMDHAYRAAIKQGQDPYRDYIHPSASGQRVMAQALGAALIETLR